MLGADGGPVGVELLGDERRQAGKGSLAELDVLDEDGDGIVRADPHESVHGHRGGLAGGGAAPPVRPFWPRCFQLAAPR